MVDPASILLSSANGTDFPETRERRSISTQAEQKRLVENHAIAAASCKY
jgi:hypothetical protein